MNKKKLLTLVLTLALIGTVGVGATLAYFTDTDDVTNTITMGKVDIDLDEPVFDTEDDDVAGVEGILPGAEFDKDPTIFVKTGSADAKLRVKILVEGLDVTLTDDDVTDIKDELVFVDGWSEENAGYYYYGPIVKAGDEIDVFTKVKIPARWDNTYADKKFKIVVTAEAIQADGEWTGVEWTNKEVVEYFNEAEDNERSASNEQ